MQNRGVVSKAYKLGVEKIVMTQKWGWLCERRSEGERNRQLKRQERGDREKKDKKRAREGCNVKRFRKIKERGREGESETVRTDRGMEKESEKDMEKKV